MDIATFEICDLKAVRDTILQIQREEFGIAITAEDQPDLGDIPQYYQKGRGEFWVVKADGRIVGTIGLKDIGRSQAALRKMFVAAPYRGAALGVSGLLLRTLLRFAREHGIERIFLGTTDKFLAAHRFYEKNGFSEIRKSDLPGEFPVMVVDTKFYAIDL